NLRLGLAVQRNLLARGQRVIMTRNADVDVPLLERSDISNRNNADLFVSLHRNASTIPTANGVETFVQIGSPPINTTYARNVQNEIVAVGVQTDRGVKQENFSVLRNTRAPAMLVELGFITNQIDNQLFDQNFDAYAAAITRGIMRSLQ
ncbi:MAG: N-acetylmuramoyl-L-alanine amidase, partial [Firmicutes bacterium]|nr:N-acetylmuramoyl-L-alanine amidase [Bacillota bacterium]